MIFKKFPFEDCAFDYVICSHSISKSADQNITSNEIKRVLEEVVIWQFQIMILKKMNFIFVMDLKNNIKLF